MSYQRERDTFIATVTREGLPLWIAERLLREATGFQRRAELACSSEWHCNVDLVPCPSLKTGKGADCCCDDVSQHSNPRAMVPRIAVQDMRAERRCKQLLEPGTIGLTVQHVGWQVLTAGDPRGYTLRVIPPSYASRNADKSRDNWESIGVPARDSRLRF